MGIEVFNRHENKFLINQDVYESLQNSFKQYMELDAFNKKNGFYTISNIYYDTQDDYLITKSMEDPIYKEKLRLRAYGVPKREDEVYLEIKKKVKGLVNKRRTNLKLEEAYNFILTGEQPEYKPYMNRQVMNEITYFLKVYDLEPKMYIAYDRKAYFSKENRDLRITFDTNIRTRTYDLSLENGHHGKQLMAQDTWLMEIKAEKAMPLWLTRLLAEKNIYKTSFSKFGKAHENIIIEAQEKKGVLKPCLNPFSIPQQRVPQFQL